MRTSSAPKSDRLHLNRFAIATILVGVGLLALPWPAAAEIVYTPTNITIGLNSSYNLDVNNDGVTDFTITTEDVIGGGLLISGSVSETAASENGALIGPLSGGEEIGPDQVFTGGTLDLESFSRTCGNKMHPGCHYKHSGPWAVLKGGGYLGLSFQFNGETYFGWVQLTLLHGGVDGATLSGYAYESTPGMPINVPTSTTTTLSSSPNPSTKGQAATFTAVVASGMGAPPNGETVSFMKGATVLGTGTLSGGSASFTTSTLKVGTTSVSAVYGGDSNFAGSKSNVVKQVVEKAD